MILFSNRVHLFLIVGCLMMSVALYAKNSPDPVYAIDISPFDAEDSGPTMPEFKVDDPDEPPQKQVTKKTQRVIDESDPIFESLFDESEKEHQQEEAPTTESRNSKALEARNKRPSSGIEGAETFQDVNFPIKPLKTQCRNPYPLRACNFIQYLNSRPTSFQTQANFTCADSRKGETVFMAHDNLRVVNHIMYMVHDEGDKVVMNRYSWYPNGEIVNQTIIDRCTAEVTFITYKNLQPDNRIPPYTTRVCKLSMNTIPPLEMRINDSFWAPCGEAPQEKKQPQCRKGDQECEELLRAWQQKHR